MKRNRFLTVFNIAWTAGLLLLSCGGGAMHQPGPPPQTQNGTEFVLSATPVYNSVHAKPRMAVSLPDWLPFSTKVYAQSVTVTNAGNYSGFCAALPSGATSTLYGIGRWSDSDCSTNFASLSDDGAPVIGNGTIGNLIVLGTGGLDANDGTVQILVNNVVTPITCRLGTGKKCTDSVNTFAVLDGDGIVATITTLNGSQLHNVRVLLGKN